MRSFRTITAAALAAGAVAVGAGSAVADTSAAPTDVTVGWADDSHAVIRVSWQESVPQANVVTLTGAIAGNHWSTTVAAEAGNEVLVPASRAADNDTLRFVVSADGGEASSVKFDTTTAPAPDINLIRAQANGSVKLGWKYGLTLPDDTPNDPLDLPVGQTSYKLSWRYPYQPGWQPLTEFGTATTAIGAPTQTDRRVFELGVQASANEWGPSDPEDQISRLLSRQTRATAEFDGYQQIDGAVRVFNCLDDCPRTTHSEAQANRLINVQHRPGEGHAWITIQTMDTAGEGKFTFDAIRGGQYRVHVPARVQGNIDHGFTTPIMNTW